MTIIETIDKIRELRSEAENLLANSSYDPHNYTRDEAADLRSKADVLENDMEKRLGWTS